MPPTHNIVIGQTVDECKVALAKAFRKELTPEEKQLWKHLRRKQLNGLHFRRQQVIDGFIVDFNCHSAGVVVEVDGPIHEEQIAYDLARDQVLQARNLFVFRVTNADVNHRLPIVLANIDQACRNR